MQFTGVDKFFRGKISQYKKCIFWKKKVTKDWHYLQSTASISPPELAFQFTYSSMSCSNPQANGAKRRSGRKPGARVTNSARLFTPGKMRTQRSVAKCKVHQ